MPSQFADVSSSFVGLRTLWHAARPILLLLAAVVLAALVLAPHTRKATILTAGIVAVAVTWLWSFLRWAWRQRPTRLVFVFESEVGLVILAIMYVLTGVIILMAELTSRYQGRPTAYLIGLISGAAVGLFAKDMLTRSDDQPWTEMHCRYRMNRAFESNFYLFDDGAAAWATVGRRWSPEGVMSEALVANTFISPADGWVGGWDHSARLARARTLEDGLAAPPEPVPA